MADTENNKLVYEVCNEYKKENIKLKEELEKLKEKIEKCYMSFDNEDELAKYVEDSIDRYIISGHITSTINMQERC